jgi:membrane fusion protein, multidrug efflux system
MNDRPTDKKYSDVFAERIRPHAERLRPHIERTRQWATQHLPGGERTLWIALGVVVLILFIWAISPGTNQPTSHRFGAGGPMPVGIAKVESRDIAITMNALGTVTPLATVTVKPQVSGELVKLDFAEGQMVAAGDVLAEIDPRSYQAALDQANGQLLRDQAQLANAELDLNRYRTLLKENSIAKQQVDTQAATVRQDDAIVKADGATVETAAINLGYTRIVSPVAGRVGLRQVDIGNIVQPGATTGIAVVTQLQPISVLFSVPEDSIDAIMARMNSGATLTVDAYDRGQTQKLASGALSTVDNQIDTTTGSVKLRAMFANTDNGLFPNQFVNMRLLVNTLHNQTAVPSAAIQRGASGSFVYVVNADSTVSMRTVTAGITDGDHVAINSGLRPGETVVVDGADRLSDGAPVLLPGAKPSTQTAGAKSGTGQGNHSGQSRGRHRQSNPSNQSGQ